MQIKENKQEIWRLDQGDAEYPNRLREIPSSPKRLFGIGRLPDENLPSVAMIGARDCSEYGKYVAKGLGTLLGREGIQVISGMARGIDGIGQRAALEAGGSSFGILGSGVDICYPAENRDLYERLMICGGIVSEYEPGTPVRPQNFAARNRIVSGLADVVVVVEARMKSGTLITVDMALEQGREVYAVPGRITERLSDGCNSLIRFGAGMLLDGKDFVREVWDVFERKRTGNTRLGKEIRTKMKECETLRSEKERGDEKKKDGDRMTQLPLPLSEIYDALDFAPKSVSEIKRGLTEQYEDRQIITYLMQLCMEEMAVQVSPGQFCIRKK